MFAEVLFVVDGEAGFFDIDKEKLGLRSGDVACVLGAALGVADIDTLSCMMVAEALLLCAADREGGSSGTCACPHGALLDITLLNSPEPVRLRLRL